MRSSGLCVGLLMAVAVSACQPAAQDGMAVGLSDMDISTLRGQIEMYEDQLNAMDWGTLIAYYTLDAVRMPPNEPRRQGYDAIMAGMLELPPVTAFTLTPEVIDGAGDMAYARGTYTLTLAPPDGMPMDMVGKWHAIYQRQTDGTWLCVSDIWNTDAPMPVMEM